MAAAVVAVAPGWVAVHSSSTPTPTQSAPHRTTAHHAPTLWCQACSGTTRRRPRVAGAVRTPSSSHAASTAASLATLSSTAAAAAVAAAAEAEVVAEVAAGGARLGLWWTWARVGYGERMVTRGMAAACARQARAAVAAGGQPAWLSR